MTEGLEKGGASRPSRFKRIGVLLTGALGVAALIGLSVWQFQRLEWKEGVIATLEARLTAAPTPLPSAFDPETQEFTRVAITGAFDGAKGGHGFTDAPLLTSLRPFGPGYRVIQPFETDDGRRVMIDRGYVPIDQKNVNGAAARPTPAPEGPLTLIGALRWPDEGEGGAYGAKDNVWTARDLTAMADLFGAEKALIVAETSTAVGEWPIPQPIETLNVPNKHLEYALTWASLAIVWAGMTGLLAWRMRAPKS